MTGANKPNLSLNGVVVQQSVFKENAYECYKGGRHFANLFRGGFEGKGKMWYACVFPIDDVDGIEGFGYGKTPERAIVGALMRFATDLLARSNQVKYFLKTLEAN